MSEIKFIEKDPYVSTEGSIKMRLLFPNYMVKDGVEYFMFNRFFFEDNFDEYQREGILLQLLNNDGMFFRFFGRKDNPLVYLWSVVKGQCTFAPYNKIPGIKRNPKDGRLDFYVILRDMSASFYYRIYDEELAMLVETVFNLIKDNKYDEAFDKLLNMPPHLAKLSKINFTAEKQASP